MNNEQLIGLTADIVSAYVCNNEIDAGQVGSLLQQVHVALGSLGEAEVAPLAKVPATSVKASVKPDYLVCLECGSKQKTLKRHLQSAHGLTPADYRRDYSLPDNYPMVSAEYSGRRREMAKRIGLGRKKGQKVGPRGGRSKK